jgi:hypothetical protein
MSTDAVARRMMDFTFLSRLCFTILPTAFWQCFVPSSQSPSLPWHDGVASVRGPECALILSCPSSLNQRRIFAALL